MKKYLAIYNSPAEAMKNMAAATPEQKAEGMKPWMEWQARIGDRLVDMGAPLTPGNRANQGGWSESKTEVSGYSIVRAENLEEAKALFENHPHTSWHAGCSIDVAECVEM